MRYGSVCSGIEAATRAWHGLGWEPAFFSEIEKFPRAVLAQHWPEVPIHGDFRTIKGDEYGAIDLLVGGTPCQDFSVAGLRKGFAGDRGNLTFEFVHLLGRTRPEWMVWENVPGCLSIDGGVGFGTFLGMLAKLGYGFAYRIFDAQYFGLAQRRARVFVVANLRSWTRAAAVLFESESLSRNPPPRRETGQRPAPTISARPTGGGGLGTDFDCDGGLIAKALNAHGRQDAESETFVLDLRNTGDGGNIGFRSANDAAITLDTGGNIGIAHALRGDGFDASEDGTGRGTPLISVHAIQAGALRENPDSGPDGVGIQADIAFTVEARSEVQAVAFNITPSNSNRDYNAREAAYAQAVTSGGNRPSARGGDLIIPIDMRQASRGALMTNSRADGCSGGAPGTGIGEDGDPSPTIASSHVPAIAFGAKDHGADAGDIAPTLRAGGHDKSHANAGVMPAVAFTQNSRSELREMEYTGAVCADHRVQQQTYLRQQMSVRRLTPRECERLQGHPDDSTLIEYRGKPAADGPRYKALGNSMAVPVMVWIGERIAMVDAITRAV